MELRLDSPHDGETAPSSHASTTVVDPGKIAASAALSAISAFLASALGGSGGSNPTGKKLDTAKVPPPPPRPSLPTPPPEAKGLTSGSSTGASGDTTSSGGVKALTDGNATGIVDAVETGGASIGLGLPLGTGIGSSALGLTPGTDGAGTGDGTVAVTDGHASRVKADGSDASMSGVVSIGLGTGLPHQPGSGIGAATPTTIPLDLQIGAGGSSTGEDSATDAVDASSERKSTETGTASSAATATNNDMDGIKTSRIAMLRKGKKLLRDFQARNERKVVGPPTPAAGNQMQLVREPEQTLVGARLPLNIPTGAPFPSPGVDPATNTIGAPSARNVANVVTPPSRDPMSDDTGGAIASQDEVVMRGHSAVDEPSTPGFDGASVTLSAKIEPVADGGHLPPDLNNVTSDDAPSGEYGIRISLDVGNALTSGSNTTSLSDDTSNLGRQARGALNDPAADVDNMTGAESTARRGDDLTRKGQRGKVQEEGISERMDGKMGAESNAIRSIDNAKSPISSSIMGIGPGDPPRKTRTRESQINRVSLWT
eukprot:jgi/Mesvir1/12544/Mv21748-RA.1